MFVKLSSKLKDLRILVSVFHMDDLAILTLCEDKTCCCLSLRSTAVLISAVSFISCLLDVLISDSYIDDGSVMKEYVETLKTLLLTLFQMANMLLLLGCIFENALLIQVYIWYMLGFIVIGFISAILEFCLRTKVEGKWSFATFVPDVIFLFVLFRCLSLVDDYKKHLDND